MTFAFGETWQVSRWGVWAAGVAVGEPSTHTLTGIGPAPGEDAADPANRRGHIIPTVQAHTLDVDVNLAPHDLVERPDGSVWAVSSSVRRWSHPMTGWQAGATCEVTQLVVDGRETVAVYPSVEGVDGYGTPTRRPADEPVTVTGVAVEPVASNETTSEGQDTTRLWRLVGRGLDVLDAFATVEWPHGSGQLFDVVGYPLRWPWPPEHAYTQVTIRERG